MRFFRNVLRVFLSDIRRLATNVVAVVIIMGLAIIPALYAWFNILSNWDPYGPAATANMQVAVCSNDEGFAYGSFSYVIGDSVISSLESNDTIGWVFPKTEEEALEGVQSGAYYAALIIPENFTTDMISFVNGKIEHPSIQYYENSKKNAIATKITGKVKTTVQRQINETFVSTLAEVMSESGELLQSESAEELFGSAMTDLQDIDTDLTTYVNVLDSFILLMQTADLLLDTTETMIPSVQGIADSSSVVIEGMQGAVQTETTIADTIAMMVDLNLDTVKTGLQSMNVQLSVLELETDYAAVADSYETTILLAQQLFDSLDNLDSLGILETILADNETYQTAKNDFQTLYSDWNTLKTDATLTDTEIADIKNGLTESLASCISSLDSIKTTFDSVVVPELSAGISQVDSSLSEAQALLSDLDTDFTGVEEVMDSYETSLADGMESLQNTRDYVSSIQMGLETIINGIYGFRDSDDFQSAVEMMQNDPASISTFIASPVLVDTQTVYEIETYGSAMAPFYTVLGLWVGALILVALIHVTVKKNKDIEKVGQPACFFGRYLTFFLIGEAQAIIATIGDLLYIHIQCIHPARFILAGMVFSFVFTLLMYSLTVAFGNVGEAIAVVIMVIQVAGAGGTFPIEVLPIAYQYVYRFLPFTYAMEAMRECVGGMYGMTFLKDLGILSLYAGASLFVGLVMKKPFQRLMDMIEVSKKKSGIML